MRVRADRIDIEKVRHTKFAEAEFEAAARKFFEEREGVALIFDFVVAEREDFVEHCAPEIRSLAKQRIADDIEIGVAGETESEAKGGASGLFKIYQEFGGIVQANAGVERHDARCGLLVVWAETVRTTVESGEIGMRLEDEVRLTGEPESSALEVREHSLGRVIRRRIGEIGGRGSVDFGRGLRRLRRLGCGLLTVGRKCVDKYQNESEREAEARGLTPFRVEELQVQFDGLNVICCKRVALPSPFDA